VVQRYQQAVADLGAPRAPSDRRGPG
jgi:hypothetical protein